MSDIQFFSKEGLANIKEELNHLITVERLAISKQIGEARDKGDLSENAEYDAAKEAQGLLELKISKLQKIVQNARLLDESKIDSSKALLLSKVTLLNKATGKEMVYTIVPEKEADFKQGKISVGSPIAKGILGKSVGDIAEIQVPAGLLKLEIIKLER
jgi:transcription elongation factor GreA